MASNLKTKFTGGVLVGATLASLAGIVLKSGYVARDEGSREISGTASGSIVHAGGGKFQATNLANAACRRDTNGRYYDCYQATTLTDTGACVAGGCATKAYVVASITKPFSGTGTIDKIDVTCDYQGKVGRIWVNQGATATAATSGSSLLNLSGPSISSGATVVFSTGSLKWSEVTPFLNLYAGVDVGTSGCLFSVKSDEVNNP